MPTPMRPASRSADRSGPLAGDDVEPPSSQIRLAVPGVVVLVGAAGAGKSTLAARLFDSADVLSSDELRAIVTGDPGDQRGTRVAFSILHREVRRRLAAGRMVVVDATNVEVHARAGLLRIGRIAGVPVTALLVRPADDEVHRRNASRASRVVPADIVDRHLAALGRLGADVAAVTAALIAEGFAAVHVVGPGTADVAIVLGDARRS